MTECKYCGNTNADDLRRRNIAFPPEYECRDHKACQRRIDEGA